MTKKISIYRGIRTVPHEDTGRFYLLKIPTTRLCTFSCRFPRCSFSLPCSSSASLRRRPNNSIRRQKNIITGSYLSTIANHRIRLQPLHSIEAPRFQHNADLSHHSHKYNYLPTLPYSTTPNSPHRLNTFHLSTSHHFFPKIPSPLSLL